MDTSEQIFPEGLGKYLNRKKNAKLCKNAIFLSQPLKLNMVF